MVTNRVGPAVRRDDFFGRADFVDLVWEKLALGHVLLVAPRRFGKTSVMYSLLDAPRPGYQLLHVDCMAMRTPGDLIAELVVQLAKNSKLKRVSESLSFFPKALWQRFRETFEEVQLWEVKVAIREKVDQRWEEMGRELFERVQKEQHPVVFILDELAVMIDEMARREESRSEAKALLRWLRKLRMDPQSDNIRFLVAGSIGFDHILVELGESNAMADLERLKLEPFPVKVAEAFLEELSRSHKVQLAPAARKQIVRLVGTPVPFFLQIMFSEITKAHRQQGVAVTPKNIERIYRETVLGVDCKGYFDHYYGRLRSYYLPEREAAAKRLLRELAVHGSITRQACFHLHQEAFRGTTNIEDFNALMTDLENDFYIHYEASSDQYEFACKILRDWWLRHYAMDLAL